MNSTPNLTSNTFDPAKSKNLIPLDNIRIATPCRADWNMMEGDDRSRFCQSCAKNVYNLSEMTKEAAESLIAEKEGHLCVRYYQRADGTILTDNCPVGLRVARRPFKWLVAGFAALLTSGVGLMAKEASSPSQSGTPSNLNPRNVPFLNSIINRFDSDTSVPDEPVVMGMVVCPAPAPTPAPEPPAEPKE